MTSIVLSFQSLKRLIQKDEVRKQVAARAACVAVLPVAAVRVQNHRTQPGIFMSPLRTAPVAEGEWLRAAKQPAAEEIYLTT
jgi:hypothetical protein